MAGLPHVVHVIDELPSHGAERLIVDLLRHASPDFRYSVLCIVRGGPLAEEVAAAGHAVEVLGRPVGAHPGTLFALMRWFRRHRVDVVHTHLHAADSYGRLAARLCGVRACFSTRHSTLPWQGRVRPLVARVLGRLSWRVIACGEEVSAALIHGDRVPAHRVAVIPNGIDLRRLAGGHGSAHGGDLRAELGVPPSALLLGTLCRLHPQKGHADLLAALTALRTQHPGFVCLLVGDGELRPQIESEVDRLGLREHVRLLGQRADVPRLLAALDAFVLPSHAEGLPIALLEAMAMSLPCVSTAVGSVPSVITDGVDGLLVPAGQPARLAEAMAWLAADPLLRQRLGQAARRTIEARFDIARTARAYEDLYRQALRLQAPQGAARHA